MRYKNFQKAGWCRYLKSVPRPSNPSTWCGIFLHGQLLAVCGNTGGYKLQQDFLMKREHLNVQTQVYDQNHIVKQRCCWSQIITNLFIDKVRINQHNEVERGKKVLRTSLSSSQQAKHQRLCHDVLKQYFGRIHRVLNKTLTDDTSIKQAQIKTFLCLIQFC